MELTEMIRLPKMQAAEGPEGMIQIQRYLFQLGEQLNFALGAIGKQIEQQEISTKDLAVAVEGSTKSPGKTFSEIKSLIIKSADIVDAYYEKINMQLEGIYVAQSTFGDFAEQTNSSIEINSTKIEQEYTDRQELASRVDGINDQLIEVNAYIKTGLLDYESTGEPMYGVEIGQRTEIDGVVGFDRYTRLTAGRLSFFDGNGFEVAWITDRTLHITVAEVEELTAKQATMDVLILGEYELKANTDGHLSIT